MARSSSILVPLAYVAWGLLLQGCATAPVQTRPPAATSPVTGAAVPIGNEVAMRALSLLGAPYEYGGNGPAAFDCSGLVRFVYDQVGIAVPRTAAEQFSAAKPVAVDRIAPGDLLFFRTNGRRVSHVAIYAGNGRFIHAPQTGRPVELRPLDDGYYRPRLAGAGRF